MSKDLTTIPSFSKVFKCNKNSGEMTWCDISDIKPGDTIASAKLIDNEMNILFDEVVSVKFSKAEELIRYDGLIISREASIPVFDETNPTKICDDMCYDDLTDDNVESHNDVPSTGRVFRGGYIKPTEEGYLPHTSNICSKEISDNAIHFLVLYKKYAVRDDVLYIPIHQYSYKIKEVCVSLGFDVTLVNNSHLNIVELHLSGGDVSVLFNKFNDYIKTERVVDNRKEPYSVHKPFVDKNKRFGVICDRFDFKPLDVGINSNKVGHFVGDEYNEYRDTDSVVDFKNRLLTLSRESLVALIKEDIDDAYPLQSENTPYQYTKDMLIDYIITNKYDSPFVDNVNPVSEFNCEYKPIGSLTYDSRLLWLNRYCFETFLSYDEYYKTRQFDTMTKTFKAMNTSHFPKSIDLSNNNVYENHRAIDVTPFCDISDISGSEELMLYGIQTRNLPYIMIKQGDDIFIINDMLNTIISNVSASIEPLTM